MEKLKCVTHYTSPDYEYSNLIARALEARQIRRELGDKNEHQE